MPRSPGARPPPARATALVAALAVGGATLIGGCATDAALRHLPSTEAARPLVVLIAPPRVEDRSLRRVLHGRRDPVDPTMLAKDRQRINAALEAALRDAASCGAVSGPVEVVALADPSAPPTGGAPDPQSLEAIRQDHPADAYLRIRVTDYGETPRRWKGAYVTFEVAATLLVAGALYVHEATRPLAGAYLLEEGIEESTEAYAGFWALNRLSRPVRIEADVVDGADGKVLWRTAHTGLARWRLGNLRRDDPSARDALLAASMQRAVQRLLPCASPP